MNHFYQEPVKLASGIVSGSVRTTTAATTIATSYNMVAILQLIGRAAFVNSVYI